MPVQKERFTFHKSERLCSRKTIESIFNSGKIINVFPVRLLWTESSPEEKINLKIAIIVPKKNFKRAVDRNKIKRHIREAYRLNKHIRLTELNESGMKFSAIILFAGKNMLSWRELEAKIILTLQRFVEQACKKQ